MEVTIGMIIALTMQTFVSKVISLLFDTLSRFVIAFLPRSKHLLILWLHVPPTVILDSKNRKSVTASTFSPSICHEVMGLDAMICFLNVGLQVSFFILLFHPHLETLSFLFGFCH